MSKLITIGMPSYNNYSDVWFTAQCLRVYHDMTDCEILIVDNYGDDALEKWVANNGAGVIRYVRATEVRGTAPAKNKVFEHAEGEFVVCVDSHVLLVPGAVDALKKWVRENRDCDALIHGPMQYDFMGLYIDHMVPKWQTHMYGVWGPNRSDLPTAPYEIEMMGMGLFACFKDKWLGFNPAFTGFGGEEGYIHEKYKKFGKKILCLPFLVWVHKFHNQSTPTSYPNVLEERIQNYLLGFTELGLDLQPIYDHFGSLVKR